MDECHNVIDESFLELEKQCSESLNNKMGQSESKKASKKMSGPETKGTSISFGFKKKIYSSSANKKLNVANNNNGNHGTKENQQTATIISNHNVIKAEQSHLVITDDDNGNDHNKEEHNNGDKDTATGRTTPRLQPAKRDQAQPANARGNRFGFRQNVVRPATGITPRFNEFDNANNNNTTAAASIDNDKRRSRSATAAARSNFTMAQPSVKTVNEERPINSNANTRPQAVVLSRYTLHSTSLPRPQYPVPVSVNAAPPSYKRSTTFTSFSSSGSGSSVGQVQSKLMDTKGAKHAANLYKRGGMMGRRDESLDSGIASHDSASDHHQLYMDSMISRRPRQRSRHFEMVPTGRHKFEIRDLSDFTDNSVVVPLSLPKLPTNRREIVTGGLIRSTNSYHTDNETDMSISIESNTRPASLISTSEAESFEDEKFRNENSFSEKSLKGRVIREEASSKNSSPGSSKASWFGNGGESMATKNCSSVSMSSSDEDRKFDSKSSTKKDIDCDDDDLSSVTITADHSSYLKSTNVRTSPTKDEKETVNDAFMRQQPKVGSISRKELFIEMDELKFAQTVDKTKDSALLDDETSPTDSLVSSSDSGDVLMKKVDKSFDDGGILHKLPFDDIKEQDLEDITPELVDLISPVTPGTPTHASNSLSLSDAHDDFLIDDEIADQPALVFNDKKHKQHGSPSHHDDYRTASMNLTSDTPTLKDFTLDSNGSFRSLNKQQLKVRSSPAVIRKTLDRSGSLDTLSPCDSIASDDLMGDFEINSSLDSIDRPGFSHDDLHMNSDAEFRHNTRATRENDGVSKTQSTVRRRHSSRESITSQLPARATRLLNRRLQNTSNSPLSQYGSESPRSLDSLHSRNTPSKTSLRDHLKQRQQITLQTQLVNSSTEDLVVDKTLRNSMLQDVSCFKKELIHLRRILQEDEDNLMRSDTLNPFDVNGQIFNALNGNVCDNEKESSRDKERKDDENNVVLSTEQMALLEDQRQELADLRRQVVFLQSQMDDKDRTIRIQQNKLEQYEKEKNKPVELMIVSDAKSIETTTCATQTERLRPVSMGQENFTSSSENLHHKSSKINGAKQIPTITIKPSLPKSKTQISSIYTKLSSIKPTTTNSSSNANSKNSSIPNFLSSKSVKTTQIGNSQLSPMRASNQIRSPVKSPKRIPQPIKPVTVNKTPSKSSMMSFIPKADSNGNSATSSLSASSSNSSLNRNSNAASPIRNFV